MCIKRSKFIFSYFILFLIFNPISVKAEKIDLLMLTDFEQLRTCITLSSDLGILEPFRNELNNISDLEKKRYFFESLGLKLLKKNGSPTIDIKGCHCTPITCEYTEFK
jgi:hypothetical protein